MTEIRKTPLFRKYEERTPKWAGAVVRKVELAAPYFSELPEIGIGITESCVANASPDDNIIRFNPKYSAPTNVVVFHELTHLLQRGHGVPYGEESCTIFAMARLPIELMDANSLPYLGNFGCCQEMALQICRDAVDMRANGHRQYIKWAKGQLNAPLHLRSCPR